MCAKILVAGGNGFIGSEICRMAVEQGHDVVSLSRHGRPEGDAPWMERVRWESGSILIAEEWRHLLEGCDAVIHAVALEPDEARRGVSYDNLYRDSVETLAWEAENAGVDHFVCISASTRPPFRSQRYIEAKREGEAALRGRSFRESILRPAYVYGPDQPASMVLGKMLQTVVRVPGLRQSMRSLRPLHVQEVAAAALRAATEDGYEGVIDVDNIHFLANGNGHAAAETGEATERRTRLSPRVLTAGLVAASLAAGAILILSRRRHAPTRMNRLRNALPWT